MGSFAKFKWILNWWDIQTAFLSRWKFWKVEFGLIRENGSYRILGAGLLSAPDEMEYAMSNSPSKPEFDPRILAHEQFDDTTLQEQV